MFQHRCPPPLAGGCLGWEYTGIFHRHEDSKKTVSEVADMLDVWWFVEQSYERLSKQDKARVEKEAEPLGKHVVFRGFDGNYEGEHLGVASFLINKLDRFADFKGRELNSHMPSIDGYRRMVRAFEPMRRGSGGGGLRGGESAGRRANYRAAQCTAA